VDEARFSRISLASLVSGVPEPLRGWGDFALEQYPAKSLQARYSCSQGVKGQLAGKKPDSLLDDRMWIGGRAMWPDRATDGQKGAARPPLDSMRYSGF
jgi:hypothetical protein